PGKGDPSTPDVTLPVTVCAIAEALASKSKTMIFGKHFFICTGFVNRWIRRNKPGAIFYFFYLSYGKVKKKASKLM
ncbi:MAG TPA: hypothetical protein VIU13_18665, partial [Chryseolinea sp.]